MIRTIEDENISYNSGGTFTSKCHFDSTPTLGEFATHPLSHKRDELGTVFTHPTMLLGNRHGVVTGAHPKLGIENWWRRFYGLSN